MVREFYANIRLDQPRGRSWVRGIKVPYDAATIKDMYHIPEMEGEAPVVDYDELIEMLGAREEDWENFDENNVQTV